MTDAIDTKALADDVRDGKGCSFLDIMKEMNINDQIKAIHQLQQENPSLDAHFSDMVRRGSIGIQVVPNNGWFSMPIFNEQVSPRDNKISYFCRQHDANSSTTKSFDVPLF